MLRHYDSFDHYATADAAKKGYTLTTGSGAPLIGAYGRNSTNGLRCDYAAGGYDSKATLTVTGVSGTTSIVGVAVKLSALPSTELLLLQIWNASAAQISLSVSTGGALSVRRGGVAGTALVTTSTTISAATFYFLELKIVFHDTTGTYEVRIDGVNAGSGTGADTIASGAAGWDSIVFGEVTASRTLDVDYDDLYVCDGSGGVEDTFLGDHRIVCVIASAGNGTNTSWSLSAGTDHGALVDETTPNTTDYVLSGTSGQRDTYNFAALGVTGTIKALQHVNYLKAEVAGIRSVGAVSRIGAVNYDTAGAVIGSDWTYQLIRERVSPATSAAWTVAEIDAAEFGVKVTA